MKLCSVTRCEDEVFLGDRCLRHQDSGHGDVTREPFDPELARLRKKLERIAELVEARAIVETALYGGVTSSLLAIREVLCG